MTLPFHLMNLVRAGAYLVLFAVGAMGLTAQAEDGFPDAMLRRVSPSVITPFIGRDVSGIDGVDQTLEAAVLPGKTAVFSIRVRNIATVIGSFTLSVVGENDSAVVVSVFDGTLNITDQVKAGTYIVADLPPGKSKTFKLRAVVTSNAAYGSRYGIVATTKSVGDPTQLDAVRAMVKVRYPPSGRLTGVFVEVTPGQPFIHFQVTLSEAKTLSFARSTLTETVVKRDGGGRAKTITGKLVNEYSSFPSDTIRMSASISYRANGTPYGTATFSGSTLRPSPQVRSF